MRERLMMWFGTHGAVNRQTYLRAGLGLMALKYLLDNAVFWFMAGDTLAPWTYVNPVLKFRFESLGSNEGVMLVFGLLSLPFIWVGVNMSVRRAKDAGWAPWAGLLFLLPGLNFLVIAGLCCAPSVSAEERSESMASAPPSVATTGLIACAMRAVAASVVLALVFGAFSIFALGEYGSALFVGTPFLMGTLGAWMVHRDGYQGRRASYVVALIGLLFAGGAFLLFALEGVICVVMTAPLVLLLGLLGAALGDSMARSANRTSSSATAMVIALPVLALFPAMLPLPPEVAPVVTQVEIDAAPEAVWPHVIGFAPLAPPEHWLFKAGVAAPVRARIEGEGVGAIRYCEFTTGAFVEPITTWDPPHHLAFDVTEQPPSMRELGLWDVVHAPHVEAGLSSRRGEFRLEALPGGRTRLTGTTWYSLDFAPEPYWRLWSDAIVHLIHERVLDHIATLAEAP